MRKFINYLLATLLFAVVSNACFANSFYESDREKQNCSPSLIKWVVAAAKISGKDKLPVSDEFLTAASCKKNPADKNQTIIALAYDSGNEDGKALLIAVLDMAGKKILSRYDGEISEDAGMKVESHSLRIDTGKYFLSKNVRAFGLDITSGYLPNCGDGGWGAVKTLYVREGTKIRPVLTDLFMSTWHFIQRGNDRCNSDVPEDTPTIIEEVTLTLSVTKKSSNGLRNLLVTAASSRDDNKKSRKPFHYVLKYDGRKYPTKKFDDRLDAWER